MGSEILTFIVWTPPGSQGVTAAGLAELLDDELGFKRGTVVVEAAEPDPPPDKMDLALDAMERGDYETGIRLARESNAELSRMIEWKNRLAATPPEPNP